jgi:hypothetical protein
MKGNLSWVALPETSATTIKAWMSVKCRKIGMNLFKEPGIPERTYKV